MRKIHGMREIQKAQQMMQVASGNLQASFGQREGLEVGRGVSGLAREERSDEHVRVRARD